VTAPWRGFYFITDSGLSVNGIVADVQEAIRAGVAMVQYREKLKPYADCRDEAGEVQLLCRAAGVPFIVNDNVELARELDADGVHVGQEDMPVSEARERLGPAAIIGVSVGSADEAKRAEADGASYMAVSPLFDTPTKADAGPGLGLETLRQVRAATSLPVAAIGGLNASNIPSALAAGADLICAISASLANGTVHDNIRRLMGQGGV
jgi:thiamine-phosphate pyrophosphorylase